LKEEKAEHDATIFGLRMEVAGCSESIAHLRTALENSESLPQLAKKQVDGLKNDIWLLQEENKEVTALNKRLVDEKMAKIKVRRHEPESCGYCEQRCHRQGIRHGQPGAGGDILGGGGR